MIRMYCIEKLIFNLENGHNIHKNNYKINEKAEKAEAGMVVM